MKLFVSAILLAVDAQAPVDERGFGSLDEFGLTDLVFDDTYDSGYQLDGALYEDNSEFTGPAADDERRRPNKGQGGSNFASDFGNGGDDYGVEDVAFGDYGGFEDYGGFNSVDGGFGDASPAAAVAPAAPAPGRPSAPAGNIVKEFAADDFGGVNDADDATPATRSCLTCVITDLANFGSCAPQECTPAQTVGVAEQDTRDYCLIEIRQTNGGFDQLEMRCAQAHDCISGFLSNVQGPDPKRTDLCRPGKDDSGVATEHWSGRWGSRQSVCRNCAVMSDGANGSGNYNIEVTAAGVTMYDKTGAAVEDGSTETNMLDWSREMWHGAANFGFLKQD